MADMRVGKKLFKSGDNEGSLAAYENPEIPGGVRVRVGSDWHDLSADEATALAVILNNHSYPHTCAR